MTSSALSVLLRTHLAKKLVIHSANSENDLSEKLNRLVDTFSGAIFKPKSCNLLISSDTPTNACLSDLDDEDAASGDFMSAWPLPDVKPRETIIFHVYDGHATCSDFVPVLTTSLITGTTTTLHLRLELLVETQPNIALDDVPQLFVDCLERDLVVFRAAQAYFLETLGRLIDVAPHHVEIGREIRSVFYPTKRMKLAAEELTAYRRFLHSYFEVPTDKPHFAPILRVRLRPSELSSFRFLTNPHEVVSYPKLLHEPGAEMELVEGIYRYHHYTQDGVNDSGWGCAYRSLQTIHSWFELQGYTSLPTPSHRLVQETLHRLGDKPATFIGSREWIGSTEISFFLDDYLGVASKILSVSDSSELCMKGRELLEHFRTAGTPVMIGGGVLAHTILGVCFNSETGDARYLVLDPHYTGDDRLKPVVDKGWCGWKEARFWQPGVFYNLCLPQRPPAGTV